ncbi:MAG: hypothetical protein HKP09_01160 [Enterobacterales bacterium]|nr:hypothetical protein [Enterobacterales bacterium]
MISKETLRLLLLIFLTLSFNPVSAGEESLEVSYVEVYPIIVTNYLRTKSRKPGFVQVEAEIAVYGPVALEVVQKHLPLVRDTIIEFIGFTDEATIKDIGQRNQLRLDMKKRINSVLEKHTGYAYVDDLLITKFMWD